MKKLASLIVGMILSANILLADTWVAYGTTTIQPYEYIDNPKLNHVGLIGEIDRFPYIIPEGYKLTLKYLQVEGPASPQFGMALWIGKEPAENKKSVISCTTPGGSTQLSGMDIIIPAGKTINIRCMNNTALPWVNGFFLSGTLDPE